MRKFAFLIAFVSLSTIAKSQMFFDFGVKGGYGVSWIANSNVWQDNRIANKFSPAYTLGGKLGVQFNLLYGLNVELLTSTLSQNFSFHNFDTDATWEKTLTLKTLDLPVLFRYNSDRGNYMEVGPQFSFVKSANQNTTAGLQDIGDKFEGTYTSLVFGFGSYIFGAKNFYGIFGFRLGFGLTDILSQAGGKDQTTYYPVESGELTTNYEKYGKTFPVVMQAVLEFNYDLGYFAKSKCERRAFIFFD